MSGTDTGSFERTLILRGWEWEGGLWYKPEVKEPTTGKPLKFTFEDALKSENLQ